MPEPILIWTASLCTGNTGYGGWAWVRIQGGAIKGAAGGAKGMTPERVALTAVLEALGGADEAEKGAALRIHSENAVVAEGGPSLAAWKAAGWTTDKGEPVADKDLWEKIDKALIARGGAASFARSKAGEEATFVTAWANFAHDTLKARGPLNATIPKTNLTKLMEKRRAV